MCVGNGQQTEIEPDSDSDAEADDDEEDDPTTTDWSLLHFLWRNTDWASQAVQGGNEQRLNAQRPDQHWVAEILPTRHHADPTRHTSDVRYGGLYGDLGIILGLLALSLRHDHVDYAVRNCITDLHASGGWRQHSRGSQSRFYSPFGSGLWITDR
jgi:hypothetical protein